MEKNTSNVLTKRQELINEYNLKIKEIEQEDKDYYSSHTTYHDFSNPRRVFNEHLEHRNYISKKRESIENYYKNAVIDLEYAEKLETINSKYDDRINKLIKSKGSSKPKSINELDAEDINNYRVDFEKDSVVFADVLKSFVQLREKYFSKLNELKIKFIADKQNASASNDANKNVTVNKIIEKYNSDSSSILKKYDSELSSYIKICQKKLKTKHFYNKLKQNASKQYHERAIYFDKIFQNKIEVIKSNIAIYETEKENAITSFIKKQKDKATTKFNDFSSSKDNVIKIQLQKIDKLKKTHSEDVDKYTSEFAEHNKDYDTKLAKIKSDINELNKEYSAAIDKNKSENKQVIKKTLGSLNSAQINKINKEYAVLKKQISADYFKKLTTFKNDINTLTSQNTKYIETYNKQTVLNEKNFISNVKELENIIKFCNDEIAQYDAKTKIFIKDIEKNLAQSIEDIANLYDKRIAIENDKYNKILELRKEQKDIDEGIYDSYVENINEMVNNSNKQYVEILAKKRVQEYIDSKNNNQNNNNTANNINNTFTNYNSHGKLKTWKARLFKPFNLFFLAFVLIFAGFLLSPFFLELEINNKMLISYLFFYSNNFQYYYIHLKFPLYNIIFPILLIGGMAIFLMLFVFFFCALIVSFFDANHYSHVHSTPIKFTTKIERLKFEYDVTEIRYNVINSFNSYKKYVHAKNLYNIEKYNVELNDLILKINNERENEISKLNSKKPSYLVTTVQKENDLLLNNKRKFKDAVRNLKIWYHNQINNAKNGSNARTNQYKQNIQAETNHNLKSKLILEYHVAKKINKIYTSLDIENIKKQYITRYNELCIKYHVIKDHNPIVKLQSIQHDEMINQYKKLYDNTNATISLFKSRLTDYEKNIRSASSIKDRHNYNVAFRYILIIIFICLIALVCSLVLFSLNINSPHILWFGISSGVIAAIILILIGLAFFVHHQGTNSRKPDVLLYQFQEDKINKLKKLINFSNKKFDELISIACHQNQTNHVLAYEAYKNSIAEVEKQFAYTNKENAKTYHELANLHNASANEDQEHYKLIMHNVHEIYRDEAIQLKDYYENIIQKQKEDYEKYIQYIKNNASANVDKFMSDHSKQPSEGDKMFNDKQLALSYDIAKNKHELELATAYKNNALLHAIHSNIHNETYKQNCALNDEIARLKDSHSQLIDDASNVILKHTGKQIPVDNKDDDNIIDVVKAIPDFENNLSKNMYNKELDSEVVVEPQEQQIEEEANIVEETNVNNENEAIVSSQESESDVISSDAITSDSNKQDELPFENKLTKLPSNKTIVGKDNVDEQFDCPPELMESNFAALLNENMYNDKIDNPDNNVTDNDTREQTPENSAESIDYSDAAVVDQQLSNEQEQVVSNTSSSQQTTPQYGMDKIPLELMNDNFASSLEENKYDSEKDEDIVEEVEQDKAFKQELEQNEFDNIIDKNTQLEPIEKEEFSLDLKKVIPLSEKDVLKYSQEDKNAFASQDDKNNQDKTTLPENENQFDNEKDSLPMPLLNTTKHVVILKNYDPITGKFITNKIQTNSISPSQNDLNQKQLLNTIVRPNLTKRHLITKNISPKSNRIVVENKHNSSH